MAEFTLRIPEAVVVYPTDAAEYVVYRVQCTRTGQGRFSSDHRYSEFRKFERKLRGSACCGQHVGTCVLRTSQAKPPPFPGTLWGRARNRDLALLEARRVALEAYMAWMVNHPLCQEHHNQLWRFIEPHVRNATLLEPVRGGESTASFMLEKKSIWTADLTPGVDYTAYEHTFAVQIYEQFFCRFTTTRVPGGGRRRGLPHGGANDETSGAGSAAGSSSDDSDMVHRVVIHHTHYSVNTRRKSARNQRAGRAAKREDLRTRLADVEAAMRGVGDALARLLKPTTFPTHTELAECVKVSTAERPQHGWLLASHMSDMSPVSDGSVDSFEIISMPPPAKPVPRLPTWSVGADGETEMRTPRTPRTPGGHATRRGGYATRRGGSPRSPAASDASFDPFDPAPGAVAETAKPLPSSLVELMAVVWGMEHGTVPPGFESYLPTQPEYAPRTFACWSLLEGKYPKAFARNGRPNKTAVRVMSRDVIRWYNPSCQTCCTLARKGLEKGGVQAFEKHQESTACARRGSFEVQGARCGTPRLHCDALSRSSSMASGLSLCDSFSAAGMTTSLTELSPTSRSACTDAASDGGADSVSQVHHSASGGFNDPTAPHGRVRSLSPEAVVPPPRHSVPLLNTSAIRRAATADAPPRARTSSNGSGAGAPSTLNASLSMLSMHDAKSNNSSLATVPGGMGGSTSTSPAHLQLPGTPGGAEGARPPRTLASIEMCPGVLHEADPFWAFYRASEEYKRRVALSTAPPIRLENYLQPPTASKDPANLRKAVRKSRKSKFDKTTLAVSEENRIKSHTPWRFEEEDDDAEPESPTSRPQTWRQVFNLNDYA